MVRVFVSLWLYKFNKVFWDFLRSSLPSSGGGIDSSILITFFDYFNNETNTVF